MNDRKNDPSKNQRLKLRCSTFGQHEPVNITTSRNQNEILHIVGVKSCMQFNIRGTSDHGSDILLMLSTYLQATRCHDNSTPVYQTIRCHYTTVCQTTATVRKHYASTCLRLGHNYFAGIGDIREEVRVFSSTANVSRKHCACMLSCCTGLALRPAVQGHCYTTDDRQPVN